MTLSEAQIIELLERVRAGDRTAAGALIGGLRDQIFRWALVVTGDHDDAEDIAQQVSLNLHRKLSGFEARSRFTTWLYTIVRNAALAQINKAHRRREFRDAEAGPLTTLAARTEDALTVLDNRRTADLIRAFFTQLPPRQRELIELVDVEGHTAADAARMIGIEPETARVHLLRARRAIRTLMLELHPEVFE